MLEKRRLVHRPEGEPSFHVFYQMLAGIDSALRSDCAYITSHDLLTVYLNQNIWMLFASE